MPVFDWTTSVARPVDVVFDFLSRPENLSKVSPPDFNMKLVEGPETLHLGARIVVQGKRWGISQRIVSVVTAFEPNKLIADEQREGPFKKWIHTHQVTPTSSGTRMTDRIEFEPPGGLLGMVLSTAKIEGELREIFAFRATKFKELLERH